MLAHFSISISSASYDIFPVSGIFAQKTERAKVVRVYHHYDFTLKIFKDSDTISNISLLLAQTY